ncbi:hypothetical protein KU306_14415 [Haloferax larsenii]|uniref:Uncharacterized protein n=1 Tax=Haloferax larsenii TaxID=302484 RepID=A0ABY5RDV8_HALLR|nr:hypothetical protein [Haloferax larsenii]UVE50083.1 hypothetical protein KU306_14415 [Haloferax larsenii]
MDVYQPTGFPNSATPSDDISLLTKHEVDGVENLLAEYGTADSAAEREIIQMEIRQKTIGAVYPEDAPKEKGFPTGTGLLAALLKFHSDTEDGNLLELIEREINAVCDGSVDVADFALRPRPYAAYTDHIESAKRFESYDRSMGRYFRLRAFESRGAFDDKGLLRGHDSSTGTVEGLNEMQREYLMEVQGHL